MAKLGKQVYTPATCGCADTWGCHSLRFAPQHRSAGLLPRHPIRPSIDAGHTVQMCIQGTVLCGQAVALSEAAAQSCETTWDNTSHTQQTLCGKLTLLAEKYNTGFTTELSSQILPLSMAQVPLVTGDLRRAREKWEGDHGERTQGTGNMENGQQGQKVRKKRGREESVPASCASSLNKIAQQDGRA